jgi:phosphatidylglycerophosphatase A
VRVRAARLLATVFGCGYAPAAPGTAGSAAALLVAAVLQGRFAWPSWGLLALAAAAFLPAVWAAGVTAESLKIEDPSCVVVDEAVGQWIALAGAGRYAWKSYLGAFLLFRLFDIWKPPPVRQLEALPSGWGIVADDVMAGAFAALVLFLARWFNRY